METKSVTIGDNIKEKAYGSREKIAQGMVKTTEEFPSEILDSLSHESDLEVSSLVTRKNEVSSRDPKVKEEEINKVKPPCSYERRARPWEWLPCDWTRPETKEATSKTRHHCDSFASWKCVLF